MSAEVIDFPASYSSLRFERGFVVLSFDLHGTTLIELAV